MDFLDYNSQDEGDLVEGDTSFAIKKDISSSSNNASDQASESGLKVRSEYPQKKKRTLDISFLPPEIQEGLIRGFIDSEDEDEEFYRKPHQTAKTGEVHKGTDQLLSRLAPAKESYSNHPPSLVEDSQASLVSSQEKGKYSKASSSSSSSSVFPNIELLLNPRHQVRSIREEIPVPSASIRVDSSSFQTEELLAQSDYGKNLRKKREREMEQRLMSGDTSAILNDDTTGFHVQDVKVDHNWDALSYADRQEREASIMNKYTNDGSVKSVVQPTKLQNRRHQLSSLALRAAETEISLLEAKGSRMKSKAQTQAKYGW